MPNNLDPAQREKEVFYEVVDIQDPDRRKELLSELCGTNTTLRERVLHLLELEEGGTEFMDRAELPTIPSATPLPNVVTSGNQSSPDQDTYHIGPEIARGGMGQIREGKDLKLGRTVALKVLKDEAIGDQSYEARFLFEAKVLAQLEHPNIVPVHDIVWENERPLFYSMKLVKGGTLQKILNDLKEENSEAIAEYPLPELLSIFQKVCAAMSFAHSRGFIHRDLKPENIMVGEFGEVLVMDWGIAKQLNSTEDYTSSALPITNDVDFGGTLEGQVMGTPQYMNPEQAAGRIDELDARSDVYALGAILYAILTLRPPVKGNSLMEILEKVSSGNIEAITESEGRPGTYQVATPPGSSGQSLAHLPEGRVPVALSAVVTKALQLEKEARYQSVHELSKEIEAYQRGFATEAEQAGLRRQLLLLIKRNQGIFRTTAAAFAVLMVSGVWFILNLQAKERRAVKGETEARAAELVAVEEKEAARRAFAESALSLTEAFMREADSSSMIRTLETVPDDLRDSRWSYLSAQADSSIGSFTDVVPASFCAHPTAPHVFAALGRDGKVVIQNVKTGELLQQFTVDLVPTEVRSSPDWMPFQYVSDYSSDGKRLAIGQGMANTRIGIFDPETGKEIAQWQAEHGTEKLVFSPDGHGLLQVDGWPGNKQVTLWDPETKEKKWTAEGYPGLRAGFTPNGESVWISGHQRGLFLVNAKNGEFQRNVYQGAAIIDVAMHPDGKSAIASYAKARGGARIDLSSGEEMYRFRTHNQIIKRIAFLPDGHRFVTVAEYSGGDQAIEVMNTESGRLLQQLLGGSGEPYGAAIHPLTKELCTVNEGGKVWDLAGARQLWQSTYSTKPHLQFIGDSGAFFAPTTGSNPKIQKWENGNVSMLGSGVAGILLPSVTPDGKTVLFQSARDDAAVASYRLNEWKLEEIGTYKVVGPVMNLRPSPNGRRFVTIEKHNRTVTSHRAIHPEATALPFDTSDIYRFSDLQWLNDREVAGLVTYNGRRGAEVEEERLVVWNIDDGEIIRRKSHPTPMDCLAVEPGGQRLAEAGQDKNLRIRDAESLEIMQTFRVHNGPVTTLAWHPERPIVATGSEDLNIRLWDLTSGQMISEIRGPTGLPRALSFSHDGGRLACSTEAGFSHLWELDLDSQ